LNSGKAQSFQRRVDDGPRHLRAVDLPIVECVNNSNVGYIRVSIYIHEKELNGRFSYFLDRIPFAWSYPLGVVEDLFVDAGWRRRGYGRLGLRLTDEFFQSRGVRTGILKVGWSYDENWEEAKAWKIEFYSTGGWIPLKWQFPEPVLMAKEYV
jgi:hypothetical protein